MSKKFEPYYDEHGNMVVNKKHMPPLAPPRYNAFVVQQYTGEQYGWEDVYDATYPAEAQDRLAECQANQPEYQFRLQTRTLKERPRFDVAVIGGPDNDDDDGEEKAAAERREEAIEEIMKLIERLR